MRKPIAIVAAMVSLAMLAGCGNETKSQYSYRPTTTYTRRTTTTTTVVTTTTTTVPLSAEEKLIERLKEKYSVLDTDMGQTEFTFALARNTKKEKSFDYVLQLDYDITFFYDVFDSIEYTEEQCEKLKNLAKEHMKAIAKECVSALPGKKILGCYYSDGYKYPNLHMDYYNVNFCVWCNYTYGSLGADNTPYADTELSSITGFGWDHYKNFEECSDYIDVLLTPADNQFSYAEAWT